MLEADVCVKPAGADEGWVAENHSAPSTRAAKIRIAYMIACDLLIARIPSSAWCGGMLGRDRRGKSAISRAAAIPGSVGADSPSGVAAISETNLWVAASSGSLAKLAASCQGSRSNRASADRTLSNIPFFSVPIGANRKLSYSDRRRKGEAARVISTIDFCRCYRTLGTARARIKW